MCLVIDPRGVIVASSNKQKNNNQQSKTTTQQRNNEMYVNVIDKLNNYFSAGGLIIKG